MRRGRVARLGLGLRAGREPARSWVLARLRRALERHRGPGRPVSGSFWINFFSTYFERIHDSLSCLRGGVGGTEGGRGGVGGREGERFIFKNYFELEMRKTTNCMNKVPMHTQYQIQCTEKQSRWLHTDLRWFQSQPHSLYWY